MGDSGAYYPNVYFPPVARVDEYIAVLWGPNDRKYYRVAWLEPIPLYEKGFLVQPAQVLSDQELADLIVGENELLQLRLALDGVVRVQAKLPKATTRWTLRRRSAWLEPAIARFPQFPPQSELFVLEDNSLFVDIQNLNLDRIEYAKVYVTGYRLVLEEVKEKPPRYAVVVVQGFAPRTKA